MKSSDILDQILDSDKPTILHREHTLLTANAGISFREPTDSSSSSTLKRLVSQQLSNIISKISLGTVWITWWVMEHEYQGELKMLNKMDSTETKELVAHFDRWC